MLTLDEVSKILKVHKITITRAINSGKIKAVKIGNCWRISEEEMKRIENYGIYFFYGGEK